MNTASEFTTLCMLQHLREERSRIAHLEAAESMNGAKSALERARKNLARGDADLARYVAQSEIELTKFRLLTEHLGNLVTTVQSQRNALSRAESNERKARSVWRSCERQTEFLDDQRRQAIRHEHRKREDREAREFLNARSVHRGGKG